MFLWLVLGLFVVSVGVWVLGYKLTWYYYHKSREYYNCLSKEARDLRYYYGEKEEKWDVVRTIGIIVTIVIGVILFTCLLVLLSNYICCDYQEMVLITEYESLCYKANSINIRDELGLLNKEYIDEIYKWNMKVKQGKHWQNHFWWGVFNPDIYNNIDVIDLWSVEMGH